jgi:hypothetical protein
MRLMTIDELKAWTTATILFLVAVLLTGCATLAGYQAETARWQAKADAATAAVGASQVTVILGPGTTGGYHRAERQIALGVETGNKDWLLAHELSHHILGHIGNTLDQEMAANANAVAVLMVWGRSEPEAVYYVERVLLSIQRHGSTVTNNGHSWCLEYRDIVRRYAYLQETGEGQELCPFTGGR